MKKEEKAVLEFLRGKTKAEISRKLNITRQATLQMIKKVSKVNNPRAKALTHEQFNELEGLRQILNISIKEVAREMQVDEKTLSDYIYRRKIPKKKPNWYIPYAHTVLDKATERIRIICQRLEGVREV